MSGSRYGCNRVGADPNVLAKIYGRDVATPHGSSWYWSAVDLASDSDFHCPTRYGSRAFAATGTSPVFLYSFNVSLVPAAGGRFACPYHCSELAGLLLTSTPKPSTPLGKVQESMGYYWLSFYRHGDPNVEKLPGLPHWPRYANQTDRSMVFALKPDGGIATEQYYRKAACDYWTNTEHGYWDESGCWK